MSTAPNLLTFLLTEEVPRLLAALHHLPVTTPGDDLLYLDLAGPAVLIAPLVAPVAQLTLRPYPPAFLPTPVLLVPGVVGVTGQLGECW